MGCVGYWAIGKNCAVAVNYFGWSVRSAVEITVYNFSVKEAMDLSVVENSEEWRLKDLEFDLLTDLLVFFIACFIPPKSNSTGKTISVSVHNDFSPLRTYIFSRRNLFIKNVNKYENRLYTRTVNTVERILISG